jgi:hypothetical protein
LFTSIFDFIEFVLHTLIQDLLALGEQIPTHYVRQCVEEGSVLAELISTKEQLANIRTKALGRVRF